MSAIDDLANKCQSKPVRSDEDRMNNGQLIWFTGKPARADQGYIAIEFVANSILTVRIEDIGEAEAFDGERLCRIGVKPEAEVIVQTTTVRKLSDCDCGSSSGGSSFVPTAIDLNNLLNLPPWALGDGVVDPGTPGYTDPCVSAGRAAELDCWTKGGSARNCYHRGSIARDWCELQRLRYPGTF